MAFLQPKSAQEPVQPSPTTRPTAQCAQPSCPPSDPRPAPRPGRRLLHPPRGSLRMGRRITLTQACQTAGFVPLHAPQRAIGLHAPVQKPRCFSRVLPETGLRHFCTKISPNGPMRYCHVSHPPKMQPMAA